MKSIKILSPAKINPFLEVLYKRSDGFHELDTVMLAVDIFDEITLRITKTNIRKTEIKLNCSFEGVEASSVPCDARNLVVKAAKKFLESANIEAIVEIDLLKRIPAQSGLGGGSSDAASVISGLNTLLEAGFSKYELAKIGSELGSDIPFFFFQPAARCRGRGEIVEPFAIKQKLHLVILVPVIRCSTPKIYRNIKLNLKKYNKADTIVAMLSTSSHNKLSEQKNLLYNKLEEVALALETELREIYYQTEQLNDKYYRRLLTGSGSAIVYYTSGDSRKELAAALDKLHLGKVFQAENLLGEVPRRKGEQVDNRSQNQAR